MPQYIRIKYFGKEKDVGREISLSMVISIIALL